MILAYDYPDIEIVAGAGGLSGDLSGAMRRMVGITDEFYNSVYRDIIGQVSIFIAVRLLTITLIELIKFQPAFGLVPVLLRPFSRGRIMLKNRNPFQWPRMIPNFFSDRRDIETLTKGARAVNISNDFSFEIISKYQLTH